MTLDEFRDAFNELVLDATLGNPADRLSMNAVLAEIEDQCVAIRGELMRADHEAGREAEFGAR